MDARSSTAKASLRVGGPRPRSMLRSVCLVGERLLNQGDMLLASHAEHLWGGAIAALLEAGPNGVDEVNRDGRRWDTPLLSKPSPQAPARIPGVAAGVAGVVGVLISLQVA